MDKDLARSLEALHSSVMEPFVNHIKERREDALKQLTSLSEEKMIYRCQGTYMALDDLLEVISSVKQHRP